MFRAACAAILCGSIAAHAEPRTDPTIGRAVFTGATTPGATSLELDPAALAISTPNDPDEFYFAGTLLLDRYSIQRRRLDLDTGALSPGDSVHATELGPGGAIIALKHLRDVTFGIGLHSETVEMFPHDKQPLAYHTLGDNERITYAFTIGGGVKLTDELLFGLSLTAQKRQLHLRYARDTALGNGHGPGGVDSDCGGTPCGVENPAAAEIYDVQVNSQLLSTDALVANIGLLWIINPTTFLALSYHSPPGLAVQNTLTGDMTVTRALRDGGGTLHGSSTVIISEPAGVDAEFRMRLPQRLDLHVGFRWEDLSRLGAYDVRGYGSTFTTYQVPEWTERPRGFHDPAALWAGVDQVDKGETLRFGGRLGFETSSVDDSKTSPMAIDPTSLTLDGGAQWRITPTFVLQATYGLQYYPGVSVSRSVYDPRVQIECVESGYDYSTSACTSVRLGYGLPTAAGDYQRVEHAFRVALRVLLP
jgi:long-subunit fatty acid transport protein